MGIFDRIKRFMDGGERSDESLQRPTEPPETSTSKHAGGSGTFDSSDLLDRFKEKVAEYSTGQLTPDAIDPRASLFDFGYLDSLTAVTMISHIQSEYGVSVSEIDLTEELDHLQALVERVARDRTR